MLYKQPKVINQDTNGGDAKQIELALIYFQPTLDLAVSNLYNHAFSIIFMKLHKLMSSLMSLTKFKSAYISMHQDQT